MIKRVLYVVIFTISLLRFVSLLSIPPFGDEAMYLYLALNVQSEPLSLFKTTLYGVFPVSIFIQAVFNFFLKDLINPLFLARSVVIFADLFSCFFVYKIGKQLFNQSVGIFSALIYLVLPITFLQSRFVLIESFTNLFVNIVIFLALKFSLNESLYQKINFRYISLITSFMIISFFTKPLAVITFPALLAILLIIFLNTKLKITREFRILLLNFFIIIAVAVTLISLLYFPIAHEFMSRYVVETNQTTSKQIAHFKLNLWKEYFWIRSYISSPIIVCSFISILLFIRNHRIKWLTVWLFSAMFLGAFFSSRFFPRHIYPLAAPFAILSSFFLYRIYTFRKSLFVVCFLIMLYLPLKFINKLLIEPVKADLVPEDRQQYFEDWTSGVGLKEIAEKLQQLCKDNIASVFIEDEFNQTWTFKYLYKVDNCKLIPSRELFLGNFINEQELSLSKQPIYIVINRHSNIPKNWPVQVIYSYPKGVNREIKILKYIKNE